MTDERTWGVWHCNQNVFTHICWSILASRSLVRFSYEDPKTGYDLLNTAKGFVNLFSMEPQGCCISTAIGLDGKPHWKTTPSKGSTKRKQNHHVEQSSCPCFHGKICQLPGSSLRSLCLQYMPLLERAIQTLITLHIRTIHNTRIEVHM